MTKTHEEFAYLPTDQLYPSEWNPRRDFNKADLEDLKASILAQGILTPLLVRPNSNGNGGKYEIAAGARRQLAAGMLSIEAVPCRIRAMTDAEFLDALHTENPQHAPLTPLDEAHGFQDWMTRTGYSPPMMAAKLGRDPSYVSRRLRLLELNLDAMNAVRNGDIDPSHALEIARLIPKDQSAALEWMADQQVYGRYVTVAQLREWIEREIHLELSKAPFDTSDEQLVPVAGSCITCPKRSGFNPDLFPDLKKRDVCTDRECFTGKVDALVKARKREFKDAGQEFVQITEGFRGGKNVLAREQYSSAEEGARGAVPAIVADGPRRGAVEWVKPKKERPAEEAMRAEPPKPRGIQAVPQETREEMVAQVIAKRHQGILKAVKKVIGEIKLSDEVCWNLMQADFHMDFWYPAGKRQGGRDGTQYSNAIHEEIYGKLPGKFNASEAPLDGKAAKSEFGFAIWCVRDAGKLDKEIEKEVVALYRKAEKLAPSDTSMAEMPASV